MIYVLTSRGISDQGPKKGDQVVLEQFLLLSSKYKLETAVLPIKRRFSFKQFSSRLKLSRLIRLKYSLRSLLLMGLEFETFEISKGDKIVIIGHFLSSILIDLYPSAICHLIDNESKKNCSYPWYYIIHRVEGILYGRELAYLRKFEDSKLLYVTLKDAAGLSNEFSLPLFKIASSLKFGSVSRNPYKLVFWGNLDYKPNLLAVKWLCANSQILRANGYTLRIIGKTSKNSTKNLITKSGIEYRGYVSDLFLETQDCGLFLGPMWSGAGIQNKVLEAMLFRIPCIVSDYLANQFEWDVERFVVVSEEKDFVKKILNYNRSSSQESILSQAGDNFDIANSLKHYGQIFL